MESIKENLLFSTEPALPVEVLLLGDFPGVPPRAHRGPRPDRRVELLGAGRRGVHGDPRAARVRLRPRAEALLEAEQNLERVAGRLKPVVDVNLNLNLPRFRLHPYAASRAAPSRCLASNSAGLRFPGAEWILTLL